MTTLKASGNTQIQKLAGAIAGNLRENGKVNVSLVGASALNQAIKACIVARRFLKDDKIQSDFTIQPEFVMQNFAQSKGEEPKEITSIVLHLVKVDYVNDNTVESVNSNKESTL